jgi:alginate O-acetyltransferase complex protein AlgI
VLSHSVEYFIFLCAAAATFYAVPTRWRWLVLCASGLSFLVHSSPMDASVAIAITLLNYFAALSIEKRTDTPLAYPLLLGAISANLVTLFVFKYSSAASSALNALHVFGLPAAESLVVPLGLSYYTFQSIGYLVEVYWGRAPAEPHVGKLGASVLFFPKLSAGPIERPHRFLAQLAKPSPLRVRNLEAGFEQVCIGIFKKCVIADRIGKIIDPIYKNFEGRPGLPLLGAIVLYTIQIYNDFSGYTDIALGTARIFGFELTPNFDRPFSARSVSEFWRRWHISLSSWTTDYVYKPLAMQLRNFPLGGTLAILITFLVLGAWHGARATFLMFGLLHGLAVVTETAFTRATRSGGAAGLVVPDRLKNVLTVAFYSMTCVFFRATSVSDACYVVTHALRRLGDPAGMRWALTNKVDLLLVAVASAALVLLRARAGKGSQTEQTGRRPVESWLVCYGLLGAVTLLGIFVDTFVYEQF